MRVTEVEKYANQNASKIIVGAKADLKDKAQVTKKEVLEFCKDQNLDCMWISSKEDKNVNELFYLFMEKIRQRMECSPKPVQTPIPTPSIPTPEKVVVVHQENPPQQQQQLQSQQLSNPSQQSTKDQPPANPGGRKCTIM